MGLSSIPVASCGIWRSGMRLTLAAALALSMLAAACGGGSAIPISGSATAVPPRAAAVAYLQARTQVLVRGVPGSALRAVCAPGSRLANEVLWWAAGTRLSGRGREIGVPRHGYDAASLSVSVQRVSVTEQAGTATVLGFTTPGPGDHRLVDSSAAFHLVSLVRTANGRWLARSDLSTADDPDLPVFLAAGGAPPEVVAAAQAEVRHEQHPGLPPPGSMAPLRAWCAAMNARNPAALKATFTADSDIQSMSNAELRAGFRASSSPSHRRNWRVVGMKLLGTQIDGLACGWVSYRYMSDDPVHIPGSRGYDAFAFLERQADGRWLIFSPLQDR